MSSFNGENWQSTLATLNGSAGGTWLNLNGVTDSNGKPITGVNYIKFSVPASPPLDPNTGKPEIMMVDAVVGTGSIESPIAGATAPSYTTPALTSTSNYLVGVTDNSSVTTFSNTASVTVEAPPRLIAQPSSQTIYHGHSATMSVNSTGTGLRYQWFVGSSGATANPIPGATGPSYTTPALSSAANYWVEVIDGVGSATDSKTASIAVSALPTIATQPSSHTIYFGQATTMSATAAGTGLRYQWFVGASGDTKTPIQGATGKTYTTAELTSTTKYWVQVTDGGGNPTNSNTSVATVINWPALQYLKAAYDDALFLNMHRGRMESPLTNDAYVFAHAAYHSAQLATATQNKSYWRDAYNYASRAASYARQVYVDTKSIYAYQIYVYANDGSLYAHKQYAAFGG